MSPWHGERVLRANGSVATPSSSRRKWKPMIASSRGSISNRPSNVEALEGRQQGRSHCVDVASPAHMIDDPGAVAASCSAVSLSMLASRLSPTVPFR